MNGDEESYVGWGKSQIDKLNKLLDEYDVKINMHKITNQYNDIDQYLNMSKKQLESLTAEDCAVISAYLSLYALYIQKEHNRESAKVAWTESNLRWVIGREIANVQGYSFEERRLQVIQENIAALKLDQLRTLAQARVNELNYISTKIEYISKSLSNLERAKSR